MTRVSLARIVIACDCLLGFCKGNSFLLAVTVIYLTDFGRHIFFRKGKGISLKVPLSPEKSTKPPTLEMIEIHTKVQFI